MADRDPQRLDYAAVDADLDAHRSGEADDGWDSLAMAVCAPVLMLLLGVVGAAVALLSAKALSVLVPSEIAFGTGAIVAAIFVAAMPVIGLGKGVRALYRMRRASWRRSRAAFAGVTINGTFLLAIAVVLYRLLR